MYERGSTRHIPTVAERRPGLAHTDVTNELARAVQGMIPIIEEGQVFPNRVSGRAQLPTGQYQGMFYGMVAANQPGFTYPFAVNTV